MVEFNNNGGAESSGNFAPGQAREYESEFSYEQLRTMKQNYLTENVINMNYDPNDFANFMEYKMGKYL